MSWGGAASQRGGAGEDGENMGCCRSQKEGCGEDLIEPFLQHYLPSVRREEAGLGFQWSKREMYGGSASILPPFPPSDDFF